MQYASSARLHLVGSDHFYAVRFLGPAALAQKRIGSDFRPIKKPECDSGFVILVKMIFVLELLNSSTTVDELLLSCKERVTR
jgi:hypothetical protein